MKQWLLAFRPKTLTAAVVPIFGATALALYEGHEAGAPPIRYWISGLALFISVLIQIGTNLINDAVDFEKGADTKERIGPVRVTQAGLISSRRVYQMAFFTFGLALLCGIPLVLVGGWPIVVIGIASLIAGYSYTGGPFPLAYRGLGDLFVVLFFGIVATSGLFFLLTGAWDLSALLLGTQIGFHCAVLIAINNLRDMHGDKLVGKRTLPVRFGASFARYEIAFLLLIPFILNFYWLWRDAVWAFALGFLILPLAFVLIHRVFTTPPSPAYNKYLGQSALVHLVFGLLTSVGLVLCR
ncbi:MAG: 1,4-dihydroxy-2-naphthoate octaprenyltransferase [Bdellovibrionaceae bacterium]|nr:1,4-dihydroxy-2-naphthoate octaprenyltransferase [Pseudobdellovibrionaceae bacterium]